MKKTMTVLAIAGLASAASADEMFNVGSFVVSGNALPANHVQYTFNSTTAGVDGFGFAGDYTDGTVGEWASDLRMLLTAPSGEVYDIGGISTMTNPPLGARVNDWSFQGSGSTSSGSYAHDGSGALAPANSVGTWTIDFYNGWEFATAVNTWDNVVVTLVPAPGAIALLGMGGLVASRRRRA